MSSASKRPEVEGGVENEASLWNLYEPRIRKYGRGLALLEMNIDSASVRGSIDKSEPQEMQSPCCA
jgi:hypothetical protein